MQKPPSHSNSEAACSCSAQAPAILKIDLTALANNYLKLKSLSKTSECAAVVKANAYGLGIECVVPKLFGLGCKTFFVAHLDEAIKIRNLNTLAEIFVLNGLFPGTSKTFVDYNIYPVLNSASEITEWASYCKAHSPRSTKAAIQVDTGMNRLGIKFDCFNELLEENYFNHFELTLLMSHLACADTPQHPMNSQQLSSFLNFKKLLPDVLCSLSNSAGIFLGHDYHFDVVRPGIALYGANPLTGVTNSMQSVVTLNARIVQIHDVFGDEFVGYGATYHLKETKRIATVSIGYADGLFRHLGSSEQKPKGCLFVNGYKTSIIGRISMDLITIDISEIPISEVARGDFVEIIGSHIKVDDLAEQAGTIGYEILTSLSSRYQRHYIDS